MDFKKEIQKFNISLTEDMEKKFEKYYAKLIEVNAYMNLTAITEHDEVYIKHFLDSISILKALDTSFPLTLCDVGSGAGFPSVPVAIVNENINVTIIDALNKRIKFLNSLIQELDLKNVKAFHFRAEEYAQTNREIFDVVTARAVARLNVLAELCLPLAKVGGYFIAMKGQESIQELDEAKKAISLLGGKVINSIDFSLPDNAGNRTIIVIQKVSKTPIKYPRAFAKIKERPL